MNSLSERVQREFESWKEKYEIPEHMEFEVKTLLKLQEEYDQVETGSNTTRTRESLLGMINRLHRDMRFNEKQKKVMYVDYIRGDNGKLSKYIIYLEDNMYILIGEQYKNIGNVTNVIKRIAEKEKAIIYIDSQGFGLAIYDELIEFENLIVKKLKYNKDFILR